MFNLYSAKIHRAVRYPIYVVIPAQILFFMLAVLFLLFWIFPAPQSMAGGLTEEMALSAFLILTAVNIWLVLLWMFYSARLKNIAPPSSPEEAAERLKNGENLNLADYLDLESARVMERAIHFARRKNIALSSAVILHSLLKSKRTDFIFRRLLVNKDEFQKSVEVIADSQFRLNPEEIMYSKEFEAIMNSALSFAARRQNKFLVASDIFSALMETDKTIQRLFFDFGVKKEDLLNVALWEERYYDDYAVLPSFTSNFTKIKGIADDWAYGYTPTLDVYSRRVAVNSKEAKDHMHILARQPQIDQLETILAKSGKNNAVLVGEAGVGKKSVIAGFAQSIFNGDCMPQLTRKKVVQLDMNLLLARSRDQASAVALVDKVLQECLGAGNIILIIEDIHNFIGPQRREELGALDISGVLLPYLRSDMFQLIGLTDNKGYHSNIEAVSSVSVALEKIDVPELTEEETMWVLEDIAPKLERRLGILISYYALFEVVNSASSFIQNTPFPKKAVELLAEVLSFASSKKTFGSVVTQDHVTEVISRKTGIPLGRIEGEEKSKLLNMEALLHERIVGQDTAIRQVSEALRRVRAGIGEKKRPIGTFLFLGPTGVGKTETAKALAAVYFGSEERMIRLDMTEYQSADSVNRLIGNLDTDTSAQFADSIREHPFSLVVLDELEKSHPNVQNLFLQILDEGRLTDVFQRHISFKNTIIIATSNAGADFIHQFVAVGRNIAALPEKLIEHLYTTRLFKPEFLNRFDGVIVFEPLKADEVKQIAALMLDGLRARLEKKGYILKVSGELTEVVAKSGFNQSFGARELRRVIQNKIENTIAERILKGEYKEGDTITLTEADIA